MPTKKHKKQRIHETNLELSQSVPQEVAVGTEIAVKVKVWCPSGCDLRGTSVAVKAAEKTVATAKLTECHDGRSETSALTIKVPGQLGEYAWSIIVPRRKIRGVVHKRSALPISFRTMPHATSLAVWANPSPVVMGNSFKIKVGAKSSGACELQGAQVEIQDETGARIGVGTLGETPWVDTGALYWTEVDLAAPMKEGVVSWSVRFAPAALKIPHDGSAAEFSFATVRPPEHSVTVNVVEKGTGVPIANAQVRVGAHRASTDDSGLATLKTSSGTYDVIAWKGGYQSPSMTVAVTEDVRVQIEAVAIPKEDPDSRWL
jgi:hypothetical protein